MPGSDDDRTVSDWRTETRFYRRPPGIGWLLTLLAVPLLIALIGWGGLKATQQADDPILTVPSVNPSATLTATPPAPVASEPAAPFGRFSIVRNATGFTLGGQLPDATQKASLLEAMDLAMPGATIVDELEVAPGVRFPDVAALGGVFSVTPNIPDFNLAVDSGTLTLTGTAPSESEKAAVESAAAAAWPDVRIVNNITVRAAASTPSPAQAPPVQAPPAAPGPGAAGACASLQADVTGLLRTPITFATDGVSLVGDSQSLLSQVADRLKACPDARIAVVGYTDNTGNDGINVPLSGNRAKSVADALVSDGVAADRVTSRGAGAANPVAGNDTPQGRAQNRRVEITVS
jgi:peptidoglycan-binding protein ArfA